MNTWNNMNKAIRAIERQLGISHDDHVELMRELIGRDSLKGAPLGDMRKVLNHLQKLMSLATPNSVKENFAPRSPHRHIRFILVLWWLLADNGHLTRFPCGGVGLDRTARIKALDRFVRRQTGGIIRKHQWVTPAHANGITQALRKWCYRAGVKLNEPGRAA
ncbi:MAG: phage protein GemA/Gp16 family protein [Pseudomonadota bacterium]